MHWCVASYHTVNLRPPHPLVGTSEQSLHPLWWTPASTEVYILQRWPLPLHQCDDNAGEVIVLEQNAKAWSHNPLGFLLQLIKYKISNGGCLANSELITEIVEVLKFRVEVINDRGHWSVKVKSRSHNTWTKCQSLKSQPKGFGLELTQYEIINGVCQANSVANMGLGFRGTNGKYDDRGPTRWIKVLSWCHNTRGKSPKPHVPTFRFWAWTCIRDYLWGVMITRVIILCIYRDIIFRGLGNIQGHKWRLWWPRAY